MTIFQATIPVWLDKICAWPVLLYRKAKYGCAFRRIYLGDGFYTAVNPNDYYRFRGYKWFPIGRRGKFYAARSIRTDNRNFNIRPLHRDITNAPKNRIVDHHNTNSLDNRSPNLRFATHGQNTYNRPKTKSKTSSRFIGVAFEKRTKRWTAYVMRKGKTRWIGRFDNEIDAAKARDKAARKYHGQFACLNFTEVV